MKRSTHILITAAVAAHLAGCGTGEASVASQQEIEDAIPVPVEVAMTEVVDLYATYRASATLASDLDAPVLARVPGEVVEILVEEGQSVSEGQILARLDGERLRNAVGESQP